MEKISSQPPTPTSEERNEQNEGSREGERPIRSILSIWNANLEMQNESVPSGERGGRRRKEGMLLGGEIRSSNRGPYITFQMALSNADASLIAKSRISRNHDRDILQGTDTVNFNSLQGKACHVTRKPNTLQ